MTVAFTKVRPATGAVRSVVSDGAATALAGVDVISPPIMKTAVGAAISGIKGVASAASGRGRTTGFAGTEQAVPASAAMPRDEVIAVGVPSTALSGGNHRAVGLEEQTGVGLGRDAEQQKQTQYCWGAHCVIQLDVIEFGGR